MDRPNGLRKSRRFPRLPSRAIATRVGGRVVRLAACGMDGIDQRLQRVGGAPRDAGDLALARETTRDGAASFDGQGGPRRAHGNRGSWLRHYLRSNGSTRKRVWPGSTINNAPSANSASICANAASTAPPITCGLVSSARN